MRSCPGRLEDTSVEVHWSKKKQHRQVQLAELATRTPVAEAATTLAKRAPAAKAAEKAKPSKVAALPLLFRSGGRSDMHCFGKQGLC